MVRAKRQEPAQRPDHETLEQDRRSHPPAAEAVVLPERLDFSTVTRVAGDLRRVSGPDIVIDAGGVAHLGALGAQLLLAARASATARGGRLILSPASDAFVRAIHDLGLSERLVTGHPA